MCLYVHVDVCVYVYMCDVYVYVAYLHVFASVPGSFHNILMALRSLTDIKGRFGIY